MPAINPEEGRDGVTRCYIGETNWPVKTEIQSFQMAAAPFAKSCHKEELKNTKLVLPTILFFF